MSTLSEIRDPNEILDDESGVEDAIVYEAEPPEEEIPIPDIRNPKPVGRKKDGSIVFDNGMTRLSTGELTWMVGDRQAIKYPGAKPSYIKTGGAVDLDAIAAKKAAERNITPSQYRKPDGSLDDEAYQSAKAAVLGSNDTKDLADMIERGDAAPDLKTAGYRQKTAVAAELSRRKYNLKAAQADWYGLQRHISSANSTPVYKLRASAETAYHSLDLIDEIAKKWKANLKAPVLNKANLEAGKIGTYGKDMQLVANQLEGQIADVLAEIAVVNQGGGVPNIPALKNAAHVLRSDWDEHVLLGMTDLARKNLAIRLNSLKSIGPASEVSEPSGTPPTPAATPVAAPTATPAEKIRVKSPDGQTGWIPASELEAAKLKGYVVIP